MLNSGAGPVESSLFLWGSWSLRSLASGTSRDRKVHSGKEVMSPQEDLAEDYSCVPLNWEVLSLGHQIRSQSLTWTWLCTAGDLHGCPSHLGPFPQHAAILLKVGAI